MYLMYGESHFGMIAELCSYLSRWHVNATPELIIVGMLNTNRTRDLTPTQRMVDYYGKPVASSTSWLKPGGGSDRFRQFIREELIPCIDLNQG